MAQAARSSSLPAPSPLSQPTTSGICLTLRALLATHVLEQNVVGPTFRTKICIPTWCSAAKACLLQRLVAHP